MNWRFGVGEMAASTLQVRSPLTVLTMSSTYLSNNFTCGLSFSLFLARQQLSKYQTISFVDAYASSDIIQHLGWHQFRHLSHSTSFDPYDTFLLQHGHKPFFSSACFIPVFAGTSCFYASSYSLNHRFARTTLSEALIGRLST